MAGNIERQQWISDLITESELNQIAEAIAMAEKKTSGEIVTMIVKRSSSVGHVPMSLTLFLYVLFLVFELPNHQLISEQANYWLILVAAVVLYAASFLIAKMEFVQRIFTPAADLVAQVERRALLEFYQAEMQGTQHNTGILIFISLFEHRVVVLADKAIAAKLPADTWNKMCKALVLSIKQKQTATGILNAVKECGDILQQHFPISASDKNELANHLIIKE